MTSFQVVDLTGPISADGGLAPALARKTGTVDLDRLQRELTEIRDALHPLMDTAGSSTDSHFGLAELTVKLTIGVEGSVWFVAKGSADASISLTFRRG